MAEIQTNWTTDEFTRIYHPPLMELIYRTATVHREYQQTGGVILIHFKYQ